MAGTRHLPVQREGGLKRCPAARFARLVIPNSSRERAGAAAAAAGVSLRWGPRPGAGWGRGRGAAQGAQPGGAGRTPPRGGCGGGEGGPAPGRGATASTRLTSPAGREGGRRSPCCSSCLVLLLAMWLGCIWLRTMIIEGTLAHVQAFVMLPVQSHQFLTLQRSLKILRRTWKQRRSLPVTSPKTAVLPRSPLCTHQGCNLPFGQQRSSRGLAGEVSPLLVYQNWNVLLVKEQL